LCGHRNIVFVIIWGREIFNGMVFMKKTSGVYIEENGEEYGG